MSSNESAQLDQGVRMQSDESYDEPQDDREDVDLDVSSMANHSFSVSSQIAPPTLPHPPLCSYRDLNMCLFVSQCQQCRSRKVSFCINGVSTINHVILDGMIDCRR